MATIEIPPLQPSVKAMFSMSRNLFDSGFQHLYDYYVEHSECFFDEESCPKQLIEFNEYLDSLNLGRANGEMFESTLTMTQALDTLLAENAWDNLK